jgi:hypothetical protein
MEKFIIDRIENPQLINCILPVISKDDSKVTLEYKDFDLSTKQITININDGEFYTEETKLRRSKDLAIRNIISMMEYNGITMEDLKSKFD